MKKEGPNTNTNRMNIKALCEVAGVSRSTVYQYLRSGLLHMPLKEGPTKLRYDETHLHRLQEVKHFREKNKLSIPEIQKLFQVKTPRQEDMDTNAEDLKSIIVDKALKLISQKGFAKTKISDIADALNMGKGTFYLYFKKKEELFLKCIERFSDVFLPKETWDEIRKERDYFKRSNSRMYFMLDSFPTFMGIVGIVKLAIRGTDPELARRAMECFQVIMTPVVKELERAIKGGIVREVDAGLISFLMFGMGEAAGYWRMINPEYSVAETTEKIMDFAKRGMLPRNAFGFETSGTHTVQGIVTDLKNNKIQLQEIHIDDREELCGKIGGGILHIDLKNITAMEIKIDDAECEALVTMLSTDKVQIKVDGNSKLSGTSPFGRFSIPLCEVAVVTMSHNLS
ncbi:MAG: TetR family transcriptional regulator [Pseudomonadota bacterium]